MCYDIECSIENDFAKLVAEQGVFSCFSSQSGIGIGLHQPADDILRARAWVGRTQSGP